MTIWLTSDNHFGHKNIIEYSKRPFADVHEMNVAMTERWNALVKPEDTVWHLGDFALDERITAMVLPKLNGKKFLVPGNHDRCHPRKGSNTKWVAKYQTWGFEQVFPVSSMAAPFNSKILLAHMPESRNDPDVRYPEYRPVIGNYDALFHGHVHERWLLKKSWEQGKWMLNVGVDQHDFYPVSLERCLELVKMAT